MAVHLRERLVGPRFQLGFLRRIRIGVDVFTIARGRVALEGHVDAFDHGVHLEEATSPVDNQCRRRKVHARRQAGY